jgi:mono/diheme cytochrome c family protein
MKKTFIALGFLSLAFVLISFEQSYDLKASMTRGKDVYETYCLSCHMPKGEGLDGVFPPLAKSKNLANKTWLIKVIVQGMRGPSKVNGVDYDGEMAGTPLTNEQTADLANYIRNSWGNKEPVVLPKDVPPALKAEVKGYQKY